MARIRTIKPEFFRNHLLYLAEIKEKLPLRLAYIGLWTACDREGRFKLVPEMLKLDCLPYDDYDFSRVLDALWKHGYIGVYVQNEQDGNVYGFIPSWKEHQFINNREYKSEFPNPLDCKILTREPREDNAILIILGIYIRNIYKEYIKPKKPKISPPSASGNQDFIDKIVYAFANEYIIEFNSEYAFLNKGKERAGAAKILQLYKEKYPEANSEQALEGLREYFALCMKVPDDWLRTNMSLSTLVSKFNIINKLIKNGRQNSKGATTEQLTAIVAKHFST